MVTNGVEWQFVFGKGTFRSSLHGTFNIIKVIEEVLSGDIKINRVSIAGDEDYDKKLIINRFMEELCRRENAVNRGRAQSNSNTVTIEEIWKAVLSNSYPDLEYVRIFIRGHSMETDNEIDVDVPTDSVILTNVGRIRCSK